MDVKSLRNGDRSLARVIATTRRQKRALSLDDIAAEVSALYRIHGNTQKVGRLAGLSSEMVREFLKINDLSPEVKELLKKRVIDSVDVAYRLAMLPRDTQQVVANEFLAGKLSSKDVRAVVSYAGRHPGVHIKSIIKKVVDTRNVKIYVAYFLAPKLGEGSKSPRRLGKVLRSRIGKIIGESEIVGLSVKDSIGTLKMSSTGWKRLLNFSRTMKLPVRDTLDKIVHADLKVERPEP